MKNTSINTIVAITTGIFILLTVGVFSVNAAPGEEYFTSTTDTQTSVVINLTDWLGKQGDNLTKQAENIWSTIISSFTTNTGENMAGVGAVINDQNDYNDNNQNIIEDTPTVTLMDNRCIQEDGVVEFSLEETSAYELTQNGFVYDLSDSEVLANFLTFTDLQDGSYTLIGFNNNGSDEVSYEIKCDKEEEESGDPETITAQCSVSPTQPEIGEPVEWVVEAYSDTGNLSYNWSGDVSGNTDRVITSYDSSGEKEGFVTVNSDDNQKTVRCSIDVGDNNSNIQSINNSAAVGRTIENF